MEFDDKHEFDEVLAGQEAEPGSRPFDCDGVLTVGPETDEELELTRPLGAHQLVNLRRADGPRDVLALDFDQRRFDSKWVAVRDDVDAAIM